MPSVFSLPKPFQEAGKPVSARALTKLADAVSRQVLAPGQFVSGRINVQALPAVPQGQSATSYAPRVGLLLTDLTSGGTAQGLLYERDAYGELVPEELAGSESYRIFEEALAEGLNEGLRIDAGRRVYVFPDIFSDVWFVVQGLRSCEDEGIST